MRITIVGLLATLYIVGCAAGPKADFAVTNKAIGGPIAGFGACMNPYLYSYPNMPAEISPAAVADLETKVKALQPQFVRIFFLQSWMEKDTDSSTAKDKPGMRQSLIRTVRLAQDAGAKVLLQFWWDPDRYQDPDGVGRRFAGAIKELREKHGLTSIRYATIQNEPNEFLDDITSARYVQVYRALDRALRELGIRDQVQIIGGDLVREKYERWLTMIAQELSPVLDGYSIHVYWDYWDIEKMTRHMRAVKAFVANLPAKQRRPVYVTEFGARGFRDNPQIEPGKSVDGKPVAEVPTYSFEIGILLMEAINGGYLGTAQWDLYDAWYDRKMGYGVIGPVEKGFSLKPGYGLLKMFTHATRPGWRAMKIDGAIEDVWVAALKGKSRDELAVFVLNRVKGEKQVTIGGLPRGRRFNSQVWNGDGTGGVKDGEIIEVDENGVATLRVPHMAIEVLTLSN